MFKNFSSTHEELIRDRLTEESRDGQKPVLFAIEGLLGCRAEVVQALTMATEPELRRRFVLLYEGLTIVSGILE